MQSHNQLGLPGVTAVAVAGTMWWHHPRTRHMEKAVFEQKAIGEVREAPSTACFAGPFAAGCTDQLQGPTHAVVYAPHASSRSHALVCFRF